MKYLLFVAIAIGVMLTPPAMAQSPSGDEAGTIGGTGAIDAMYNGAKRIAAKTEDIRVKIAGPIAFVLCVAAMMAVFREANSQRDIYLGIVNVTLIAGAAAMSTFFMGLAEQGGTALAKGVGEVSGIDYENVGAGIRDFSLIFIKEKDEKSKAPEDESEGGIRDWPIIGFIWKSAETAGDTAKAVGNLQGTILAIVLFIMKALIGVVAWFCGLIIDLFIIVQNLLITLGEAFLPVAIAALATKRFQSTGMNYIMTLLCLALWPLGWALGHVVTGELMGWLTVFVSKMILLPAGQPSAAFGANAALYGAIGVGLTGALKAVSLTALFMVLVAAIAVGMWIILVTFSAPVLISRMVTQGGQFFGGLVQGYAQTMTGMAGEALNAGTTAVAASVGGVAGGPAGAAAGAQIGEKIGGGMKKGADGVGAGVAGAAGESSSSFSGPSGEPDAASSAGSAAMPSPHEFGKNAAAAVQKGGNESASVRGGRGGVSVAGSESVVGTSGGGAFRGGDVFESDSSSINVSGVGGGADDAGGMSPIGSSPGSSSRRGGGGGSEGGASPGGGTPSVSATGGAMQKVKGALLGTSFAAARTMINASKWSGDPTSFSGVPDYGFDERRRYRMEDQIAKQASGDQAAAIAAAVAAVMAQQQRKE